MPRSLQLRPDCQERVKMALLRSGYTTQQNLADDLQLTLTTVNKFFNCKSISNLNFVEICGRLNLDWEEVADVDFEKIPQENNEKDRDPLPEPDREETSPTYTIPSNLDRRGILDPHKFVGRETQLQELHDRLTTQERVAITGVVGMGGVGKTELAVQYARQHVGDYRGGIVWLLAPQAVSELLGFAQREFLTSAQLAFMEEMKTAVEKVQFCWRHWPVREKLPESVLLVFDDVTDYREQVGCYLPEDKRFRVLLTTRERFQGIDRFDLDVLAPADALALLKAIVGEERIEAEADTAMALCEWLGYLPLGLQLVAYYLVEEPCELWELLEELERRKNLKHPSLDNPEPTMTAQYGVEAAFELSWERLDIDARFLGAYISLFAAAPIRWSLIVEAGEVSDEANDGLNAARRKLVRFSLLQHLGSQFFQFHPLVRLFFAQKRDSEEFVMPPEHQMTGATSEILRLFGAPEEEV